MTCTEYVGGGVIEKGNQEVKKAKHQKVKENM